MSDIVTCRLWVPVEPKQLYNPVLSLLANGDDTASHDGGGDDAIGGDNGGGDGGATGTGGGSSGSAPLLMRTTAELRYSSSV